MSADRSVEGERLPHEPNRIVIGFTESPDGKPVIGMTFGGRDWILLKTLTAILADRSRLQLLEKFDVESHAGPDIDVTESLARRELVLFPQPNSVNNMVSIFVPAENFDMLNAMTDNPI